MTHRLHAFCLACGVQVELAECGTFAKRRPADETVEPFDPADIPFIVEEHVLCKCPKCESPFLFKREWYEVQAEFGTVISEPELLYPTSSRLPVSSLPQAVAKSYQNATRAYDVGLYEPCVIMCRKCLEALCHQHGASRGNLKEKLLALKKSGVIDSKLHAWTDGLRLIGNDAAHDLDADIEPQDAKDSLEFIEAAISYVFLLGKKFQEFEARRRRA